MKTLYFTATGNSLYVAKRIGGELLSIPRLMAEGRFNIEDDVIGVVFPCYGWGVPRIVSEFLGRATLKAGYSFGVMTYGNISGGGLHAMEIAAARAGVRFDYTAEILMVDNYLPIFDMAKQVANEEAKGIEAKLSVICADIAARKRALVQKNFIAKGISASLPPLMARLWLDKCDRKFYMDAKCDGCGVCSKVCPRGNISLEPKPVFHHHCEGCLACINNCPKAAMHLTSEKSAARFRNGNTGLAEIVSANDMTARPSPSGTAR